MTPEPPSNGSLFGENALREMDTLTVRDLTTQLTAVVRRAFPKEIWVRGEIRNLNRSASGHVYFTLVEPKPSTDEPRSESVQRLRNRSDASPKHTVSVVMFNTTRQSVNRILKRSDAGRMEDGMEIRIRAAVEFHAPRGSLQLRMTSIDPEYTLGRLASDRAAILKRLSADGLLTANHERELPLVPLRIALITSAGSAAAADFTDELARSGYRFDVRLLDSRVQGDAAAESLVRAIESAQHTDADVIAIIRGGGSQIHLSTFDNEGLARAIASSALPVLAGIGHETDRSIADEVAHTTRKTPTACANFLVDAVREFDERLTQLGRHIAAVATTRPQLQAAYINQLADRAVRTSEAALDEAMQRTLARAHTVQHRTEQQLTIATARLDRSRASLAPRSQAATRHAARLVTTNASRLTTSAPRALRSQERDLINWHARVRALDPVQTLRRGFSITTDSDGNVVRSAQDVPDNIVTHVADGEIQSRVTAAHISDTVADTDPDLKRHE